VGTDRRQALAGRAPEHDLTLPFGDLERCVARIRKEAAGRPIHAVLGVDDETTLPAAAAAAQLGLPHNPVAAVRATRDKFELRWRLTNAGRPGPRFERVPLSASVEETAERMAYPCVLKPLFLSASRGVLRADDPESFVEAFRRIAAILADPDVAGRSGDKAHLLVEDYLPGREVALEGLLKGGELRVLALFDKPDPTLYVTPSRHPNLTRREVAQEAACGCRALGLQEGPVHVELRLDHGEPWIVGIAARTIGGLCSRALHFGSGLSLEELVLHHALGLSTSKLHRERAASGVMVIPVPRGGILRRVHGLDAARAEPGIEEVVLAAHVGAELVPLPEGHRYLGFLFARAGAPDEVEQALRRAQARLAFEIGYFPDS
jgi:biotin carboxylase